MPYCGSISYGADADWGVGSPPPRRLDQLVPHLRAGLGGFDLGNVVISRALGEGHPDDHTARWGGNIMNPLADIHAAICKHYPWGISRSRLVKTAFLVNWESVRLHGRQASDARWYWDREAGPTTRDIDEILEKPPFRIVHGATAAGAPLELVMVPGRYMARIPDDVATLTRQVVSRYGAMHAREFLQVVYSTRPLLAGRRGYPLDLTALGPVERKKATL